MEALFQRSIEELSLLHRFSEDDMKLFERVDRVAEELLPVEYESYIERRFNSEAINIMSRHGILGIPIGKEYGGLGADPITATLAYERLGQVGIGASSSIGVSIGLAGTCIQTWGNEDLKDRYLRPACRGDMLLAYALTEPEAGSDPTSIKTVFEEKSDHYVVNGSKYLITNGSVAKAVVVFARSSTDEKNVSAFIVDKGLQGFNVAMELKEKLGFFTSDTALLEFDDVIVPKENLLGIPGKGLWIAYTGLISGRMNVAAACIGVQEDCLNAVKERASTRMQHGKLIGKHQLIQKHIAEMAMDLEASRWPTYMAAHRVSEWARSPFDDGKRQRVDQASAIAKRVASRAAFKSADRAVQVFGGFGYSLLSPVARHYLDARAARIYEGTDEIMDLKIASGVLGKEFQAYR